MTCHVIRDGYDTLLQFCVFISMFKSIRQKGCECIELFQFFWQWSYLEYPLCVFRHTLEISLAPLVLLSPENTTSTSVLFPLISFAVCSNRLHPPMIGFLLLLVCVHPYIHVLRLHSSTIAYAPLSQMKHMGFLCKHANSVLRANSFPAMSDMRFGIRCMPSALYAAVNKIVKLFCFVFFYRV